MYSSTAANKESTILFNPTIYKQNDLDLVPANYKMSPEDMAGYGKLVTKLRRQFEEKYR